MWWALSLAFGVIGIFTAVMLRWLYSPGFVNLHVMFNVWFSWTMALAFVALVPIDLNLVYVERCLELFDGNTTLAGERCPMEYWRWAWNTPIHQHKIIMKLTPDKATLPLSCRTPLSLSLHLVLHQLLVPPFQGK